MKGGLVELKRIPNVIYDILMEIVVNYRQEREDCSDDSDNLGSLKERLCQGPSSDRLFRVLNAPFWFLIAVRGPEAGNYIRTIYSLLKTNMFLIFAYVF